MNENNRLGRLYLNKGSLITIIVLTSIINLYAVYNFISAQGIGASLGAEVMLAANIIASLIFVIVLVLIFIVSGSCFANYRASRDTGRLVISLIVAASGLTLFIILSLYLIGDVPGYLNDSSSSLQFFATEFLSFACVVICIVSSFIFGVEKECEKNNIFLGKISEERYAAFPGDTYVYDAVNAYNSTPKWLYAGIVAIIAAVVVDFSNLKDVVAQALHQPSTDPLPMLVAASITIAYLILGIYVGNSLRHYLFCTKSNKKRFLIEVVIGLILVVGFIFIVAIFRYNIDSLSFDKLVINSTNGLVEQVDPIVTTLIFTTMMFVGAFVSLFYGYKKHDMISEEIMNDAKNSIDDDKNVYRETFQNYIINHFDEEKWEKELRELDSQYFKKTTELANISLKMSMIHDPSQAADIAMMTKKINDAILGNN